MKNTLVLLSFSLFGMYTMAQSPEITSWIINTTGTMAQHYVSGNPTPITDNIQANVQTVQYSNDYVYISCTGLPSYIVGPYLDGNPAQATDRSHLFKIPRHPVADPTPTTVGLGQIAVFINGVPAYNYSDAMSYNDMDIWHRNAVYFENDGFDCAKGHPSPVFQGGPPPGGTLVGGTYHHHQNPCAFNISTVEMSNVCDVYLADGLYVPNASEHSPLIGYAFDGYPIYGGYGYANTNGTGGIARMTPSYQLRQITDRTTLADGTVLQASEYGPSLASTPLGAYAEDFEYVAGSGDLDEHNGRFCVTPEYPNGTYAYFATIDDDNNSVFPYIIAETYYGEVVAANFPSPGGTTSTNVTITESVTTYDPSTADLNSIKKEQLDVTVFPNPVNDILVIQSTTSQLFDRKVELIDAGGNIVATQTLKMGSTMCYFDVATIYAGNYFVKVSAGDFFETTKIVIE